jgi:hypothetical protein
MRQAASRFGLVWVLLVLLVTGCAPAGQATAPTSTHTAGVAATQVPGPTTTAAPSATPPPPTPTPGVWAPAYLPAGLREAIDLSPGVTWATSPEEAAAVLDIGGSQPAATWVYALVAPFSTIPDGVSFQDLQAAWNGEPPASPDEFPFAGRPLLLDESTLGVFTGLWGEPASAAVEVLPADELVGRAWADAPAWALVPFEALEPRWKVLEVAGQSPLRKDFELEQYPLVAVFGLEGEEVEGLVANEPLTNRDPQKLTTVILTGVTALVRATAETMRRRGNTYPAEDIAPWLNEADLVHINNEVPFDPDCPHPNPRQEELVFCSRPEYIELLEASSADLIELSGDHFADFGPDAMQYTLDLYTEKGMPYYGGGYTEEDARKPFLFEHNGNKIAFLGCNGKGGGYATARGENPGAVECDYDLLAEQIASLKAEGYLPIVTIQHFEYYTYVPQPKLVTDFRKVAQAGALVVSGSQAHQPHGMEFYEGAFIHYGLGNLYFDQYHFGLETGHAFIDRHVFYDGQYLGTELLGIRFIDFARPRPATPEERQELLERAFAASLW